MPPALFNLTPAARRLLFAQTYVPVFIDADSLWSPDTQNRLGVGWRDTAPIEHAGIVAHAQSTGSDVLALIGSTAATPACDYVNNVPDAVAGTAKTVRAEINGLSVSFSGGVWVSATKTLTKVAAFTNYTYRSGDNVYVASGTGATPGWYAVASRVSADAITLTASFGANNSDTVVTSLMGTPSFPGSFAHRSFERRFTGPVTSGGQWWRAFLSKGVFSGGQNNAALYKKGDWLDGNAQWEVIFYNDPALTQDRMRILTYRDGANVLNTALTISGTGIVKAPAVAVTGTGEPHVALQFAYTDEQAYTGPPPAVDRSLIYVLGALFRRTDKTFGAITTILSLPGATVYDKIQTTEWTAPNFAAYLAAAGAALGPPIVIIWLGQNLDAVSGSPEVSGGVLTAQWKANIQTRIAQWRTAFATAGATAPLFVLVSTYRTAGWNAQVFSDQAQALFEIARDNTAGDIGFANVADRAGEHFTELSNGTFGSDGVHTSTKVGSDFYAQALTDLLLASSGGGRSRKSTRYRGMDD